MFARNEFYNNLYKAVGSEVSGTYMGVPFLGVQKEWFYI